MPLTYDITAGIGPVTGPPGRLAFGEITADGAVSIAPVYSRTPQSVIV